MCDGHLWFKWYRSSLPLIGRFDPRTHLTDESEWTLVVWYSQGVTSTPRRKVNYGFSGFIPKTNKQTNKQTNDCWVGLKPSNPFVIGIFKENSWHILNIGTTNLQMTYFQKFSKRVLTDFQWFIRHLISVVKNAALMRSSYPQVPGLIPAENTSAQIHIDLSKYTLNKGF